MAASPPHTDGSVVFAKWRQCATHIQKAKNGCHGNVPQHLWTPSNTIPTAHPSPQPKRHLNRFSGFCTDDRRVSLYSYFTMGRPFPVGDLNPHLIHGSLCPSESSTQTASRSVQLFLQDSLVWQTDRPT